MKRKEETKVRSFYESSLRQSTIKFALRWKVKYELYSCGWGRGGGVRVPSLCVSATKARRIWHKRKCNHQGRNRSRTSFPNLIKISPVQQVWSIIQEFKIICIKVNSAVKFLATRVEIRNIFVTKSWDNWGGIPMDNDWECRGLIRGSSRIFLCSITSRLCLGSI